ncbi:SH3 domain-containing protein [Pantanalinema rosaneae CENA516]|uniref:SH3 domain-containing protein n=1 Tax=Pantanalinema rosaneae TaxID=1620701 RepID=UPI003D6F909A
MKFQSSVPFLAGAASLAAIAGITYTVVQSSPRTMPTITPSAEVSAVPTISPPATAAPSGSPPTPTTLSSPQVATPGATSASAPTASRQIKSCEMTMAKVNDPDAPLNIRSQPTTEGSQIVGTLRNGEFVTVEREQDGWLQISVPMSGWIAKNRTETGCNQKLEQVSFAAGQDQVMIRDRFIGTGSHRYVLQAKQGQTITVTREAGAFPAVIAPNGKYLTEDPDDRRTDWSGQATQTGEYIFQLDSNFRGYNYAFSVQIQ